MTAPITVITTTVEYQGLTAAGALIVGARFHRPEDAALWFETNAHEWPGCRVRVLRTRVTEQTLFEDQPQEKAA